MLTISNLSVQFGKRILFDHVNISFTPGNCYGIIGANGSGKSTLLKILSGKLDPTSGKVHLEKGKRLSVLEQNHNAYDQYPVLETVLRGNTRLFYLKQEIDRLYNKPDFNEQDGQRVGVLQLEFEDLDGWNAESEAATLLSHLNVTEDLHNRKMEHIDPKIKVRVLLAQALFGNPDVLIMDEPTNDLDYQTIQWLNEFLYDFENTAIVVSHDRYFLDAVCTHISDIDFGKITHFSGNYTFWYESSQLAMRQAVQQNKKMEEKKKELQEFIRRFSANVAKSKQATARKKMITNLKFEEIKPSSRKYPGIIFKKDREVGDQILNIERLSARIESQSIFENLNLNLEKLDKVLIYSKDQRAVTTFFEIITHNSQPHSGKIEWGLTTTQAYLPYNHDDFFENDMSLVEWLHQFARTQEEKETPFLRGFLGKMLFSGDEALKSARVLSGGEKVRCMLSRMMMQNANVLILDQPTNHLDLESITALNNSLKNFQGNILFSTTDHRFAQTIANRIVELTPSGCIDRHTDFEDYLTDTKINLLREQLYQKELSE
ncbi:MAG: ATP-binding cassette domain-containing protein [Flavobacteriaceae bacterium]|nr:ATP-binding cassette domain-containing protein [Flavobacteriaceae bacterium]